MTFKYGDEGTTSLDLKFNNGRGALLCHCSKIMAEGFDHEGKIYECKCGSLHQIVRLNTDDPSVYTFGTFDY
jgi:hypothetical protein